MTNELVLVLDFGAQYNQLIARRVREANVYCEVVSCNISAAEIKKRAPKGIIFTGGPSVVYAEGAPTVDQDIFDLGIPILGICYGAQLIVHLNGGEVEAAIQREYGKKDLMVKPHAIFSDVPSNTTCWMSHTYQVKQLPADYTVIANTDHCPVAAFANDVRKIYGFQYHPEVMHTPKGTKMLHNFLYEVCACVGEWKMSNFVEETVAKLREEIGDRQVLCALSGGVDSSVAAMLVHKAVGKQLTCIFVDNGLLRKDEAKMVEKVLQNNLTSTLFV